MEELYYQQNNYFQDKMYYEEILYYEVKKELPKNPINITRKETKIQNIPTPKLTDNHNKPKQQKKYIMFLNRLIEVYQVVKIILLW